MNQEEIRNILKIDKVTNGFKISDNAVTHIEHLLKLFDVKDIPTIAIRFYALGYVTGKLEK